MPGGSRQPATRPGTGPGGGPQGRAHGDREPGGKTAVSPFENPALATAGPRRPCRHDRSASGAGLGTFEAAQLGVYMHGMAGEAVRARIGDAGLLASDLCPELPLAGSGSRRLRRPRTGGRHGIGPLSARQARRRQPKLCPGQRRRSSPRGCRSSRSHPGSRFAVAAQRLDRDRPGRSRFECPPPAGLAAVRDPFRSGGQGDAYGHGAVPVARALVAAGVPSLSVATFDEGLELRQAASRSPSSSCSRSRPSSCPTRCASVSRHGRRPDAPGADPGGARPPGRPRRRPRPASRRLRVADPPRGRDRSRSRRPPLDRYPGRGAPSRLRRGLDWPASGRTSRRPATRIGPPIRLPAWASPRASWRKWASPCPTAISPPAASARRQRAGLRRRPHRPRHVRHRADGLTWTSATRPPQPASGPSSRCAPPGASDRAPRRHRRQLRPHVRHGASQPHRHVALATPMGCRGACPTRPRSSTRGAGPGRRHSGHGRCDDRRHRRSGAPVSVDDEFTLIGTQAASHRRDRDGAVGQHHLL